MSLLNLISNGFPKDIGPGNIVDVVIVVSIVIFPVLSGDVLKLSYRKILKDRSLRVGIGEECNGITSWKSVSEEDSFITFSRSGTMLIF